MLDSSHARVGELAEDGIPGRDRRRRGGGGASRKASRRTRPQAIAGDYGEAQLQGLKLAIGAVAFFALISLWFTRGLPGRAPPAAVAANKRSALAEAR